MENDQKKPEKKMNKGLQIRQNKWNKKAKKRAEVKPRQEGMVRFVEFYVRVIERINGKYRHPTRREYGRGLQIENKIYTADGHYKYVNRSTLTITERYTTVPEWADPYLLQKYQAAMEKKTAAAAKAKEETESAD